MTTETISTEVEQLEHRYWQTMRDRDVDAALALTDDPCIVAGASGASSIDHATFRKIMTSAEYRITDVQIGEMQSRVVNDDLVVLAYTVRESLELPDGPVTFEAADSSVWVRRDGAWRCAMHSESVLGDAYGRDRTRSGQG